MKFKRALVVLLVSTSIGVVTAQQVSTTTAAPRPNYVGCCR